MRKIVKAFLAVFLIVGLLAACDSKKQEPANPTPRGSDTVTSAPDQNPSPQNPSPTPAPTPDPNPAPSPAPAPDSPATSDPIQTYGINEYIAAFNNYGKSFGISMGNAKVYQENDTEIVFSIPVSNGTGVGVGVDKQTKTFTGIAVAGAVESNQAYESFFDTVRVVLYTIDPSLTPDDVEMILNSLGYGTGTVQLNKTLTFDGGSLSIQYDANSKVLIFQYEPTTIA